MTINVPLWIDIWADGEYEVHAPTDGKEPEPPRNVLLGWKRYKVFVPVPLPPPVDGTAKISHDGFTQGNPKAEK